MLYPVTSNLLNWFSIEMKTTENDRSWNTVDCGRAKAEKSVAALFYNRGERESRQVNCNLGNFQSWELNCKIKTRILKQISFRFWRNDSYDISKDFSCQIPISVYQEIWFKLYPLTVHCQEILQIPSETSYIFPNVSAKQRRKTNSRLFEKISQKKHPQKSNCVSNSEPEPVSNKTQLRYLLSIKLNQPKPIFKIRIQRGTPSLWKKHFQITTNVPVKQRIQQIINHVSRLYHATLIQNQITFS